MESGKDRRVMTDDVDHDLLPIFLEEAKEIIPQVGDSLRRFGLMLADSPQGPVLRAAAR